MGYNKDMDKMIKFSEGFLWGTGTAAHQFEGGNYNQWSEWEESSERTQYLTAINLDPKDYISGKACDHYNRFETDFDLAKAMHNNAHRFSIEWSRIEPQENRIDVKEIEHYRGVIKALKTRGMEPFVTLWHWTVPVWFANRGGFENRRNVVYFTRFCERMVQEFGSDVRFWITINEPTVYSGMSYYAGIFPPQQKSALAFLSVLDNLAETHCEAYDVIHDLQDDCRVGIAHSANYFEGWAAPFMKWFWHRWFLNKIQDYQDFIGINYYYRRFVKGFNFDASSGPRNDRGWEIYPEGIYHILKSLARYKKPFYITENGLADRQDEYRAKFIIDHLLWIHKAIAEGVDVRGYFHWSLLDFFEWEEGFWPRFGLFEVDYKTQKRKPRPSSRIYGQIAAANAIPQELIGKIGG